MKPAASKRPTRLRHVLLWSLEGGLLLLFLGGYLARYIHPETLWWLQMVAIGLPYLSLLVGVGLLVWGGQRRWRWVGIHALLLLLVWGRYGEGNQKGTVEGLPALRVMTLNMPAHGDKEARWQAMRALVEAQQPNMITTQEAPLSFHDRGARVRGRCFIRCVADSLGYTAYGPTASRPTYTVQPVLAKGVVLTSFEQRILNPTPEDDPEARTFVIRTTFRWEEQEVVLYNLHMRSYGARKFWREDESHWLSLGFWWRYWKQYREAVRVRAWEAEQIRQWLAAETGPLIVMGDFNGTSDTWAYRHLRHGLQDAFAAAGTGWGGTYHRRLPFARIDHILVSAHWYVADAAVPASQASDHLPLLATLHLRPVE